VDDAPHILVVDDDREIRTLLGDYLAANGYLSTAVADGRAMERALERGRFDLVVLDLMLPGEGGLQLCQRLRQRSKIPVIMLTARADEVDRIVGFEFGADDYVPKPFSPRELLARIRAVLRRAADAPREPHAAGVRAYVFAGWRLDTVERSLTSPAGVRVELGGAEYQLLSLLLANPQRVLSRLQVMDLLQGREASPSDRSIDVRISRLRQKLGDDGRAAEIIRTVYGEGYVIGVAVETE
jgi:two-component system OmpR family response regulator